MCSEVSFKPQGISSLEFMSFRMSFKTINEVLVVDQLHELLCLSPSPPVNALFGVPNNKSAVAVFVLS